MRIKLTDEIIEKIEELLKENEKKEAFIRQEYSLGETLEFEWGEVKVNELYSKRQEAL